MEQHTPVKPKRQTPAILGVPKGKSVFSMPITHFVALAKARGKSKIMSALVNLEQWNKIKFPDRAKAARKLITRLEKSPLWKKVSKKEK